MIFKTGRYSGFLRPISYIIDLLIIHIMAYQFFESNFLFLNYVIFVSLAWIFISMRSNFYEIYRFTRVTKLLSLVGKQGILFFLLVFAFFGFYSELGQAPLSIITYALQVVLYITIAKLAIYYLLKKYRVLLRGNLRRVVILGAGPGRGRRRPGRR